MGSGASGSSDHTLVASSKDAKLLHCCLTYREPSTHKNKVRDTRGCLSSAACENPDRMIISDQPLRGIIEYVQRLYRTTYAKSYMQGSVWNLCTKCAASKNGDTVYQWSPHCENLARWQTQAERRHAIHLQPTFSECVQLCPLTGADKIIASGVPQKSGPFLLVSNFFCWFPVSV